MLLRAQGEAPGTAPAGGRARCLDLKSFSPPRGTGAVRGHQFRDDANAEDAAATRIGLHKGAGNHRTHLVPFVVVKAPVQQNKRKQQP